MAKEKKPKISVAVEFEDPYGGDLCGAVAQLQRIVLQLLNKEAGIQEEEEDG